jgi:putative glutamine amidotransferase
MKHSKPNIGVTGPDRGGLAAWFFTRLAVAMQGGRAVRITPGKPNPEMPIHGLILGGGADISPSRYAKERASIFSDSPKLANRQSMMVRLFSYLFYPVLFLFRKLFSTSSHTVDEKRDEMEFDLLEKAMQNDIPVLGICRGEQLINVHLGGALHQNLKRFYSEVPALHTIWPAKKVTVETGTRLNEILNVRTAYVNALHYQAVDSLGKGLQVAAREESGVIQAIEHCDHFFVLGVQWHPEFMPQVLNQRQIFKSLVTAAAQKQHDTDYIYISTL